MALSYKSCQRCLGPSGKGPLDEPGRLLDSRGMGGGLLLADSIWGTLLQCSSALPAQHSESGEQGALKPRLSLHPESVIVCRYNISWPRATVT